ncbi:hypothetical protein ACWC0C_46085 [Streptomyces sp. NPDC001709]
MAKKAIITRLAATIAISGSLLGLNVGSAHATPYGVHIQSGNNYQTWTVWQGSNGWDQIQDSQTGRCLAVNLRYGADFPIIDRY